MNLKDWINDWPYDLPDDIAITGLCLDTRVLQPGQAFIALAGWQFDGHQFIEQAIELGASVVLAEADQLSMEWRNQTLILNWPKIRQYLSELAARFYNPQGQSLDIIGVTGTNGKTSIAYLLSQALQQAHYRCAYSGTLGQGHPHQLQSTTYGMTTPDAIETQRLLADWHKQDYSHVAMEVSSHGLALGRVNAVPFRGAIFSNLSHDHLDFHASVDDYVAAKAKLFAYDSLQYMVLNADDTHSESMRQAQAHQQVDICYYSIQTSIPEYADAFVHVLDYRLGVDGIQARLDSSWGQGQLQSPLLGHFNLSNLLAVLCCLCMEGIPWGQSLAIISNCQPVHARMETIRRTGWPTIIIDYAHTPDALEQMLKAVRYLTPGQVHCLFGCGGDRDRQKRPWMGQVASQYADAIWLTTDNPRSESPQAIIDDIHQGVANKVPCHVELDRLNAINSALKSADSHDVVVVAGKGHERYRDSQGHKVDFSDIDAIYSCLDNTTP